jgi:hypothetical protein
MKLTNLLNESIIDNLSISKLDKAILKTFNTLKGEKNIITNTRTGEVTHEWDYSDGDIILKTSEYISYYDYDNLIKLYKFYKKYNDILFIDFDEYYKNIELDYEEDYEMMNQILLMYYYKNYVGKSITTDVGSWNFTTPLGDIETALFEENYVMELFLEDNSAIVYCSINPTNGYVGGEMISNDDELAEFNGKVKDYNVYEEIIGKNSIKINPPRSFKNNVLKVYFDTLIEKIKKDIIEPNEWVIMDYRNQ